MRALLCLYFASLERGLTFEPNCTRETHRRQHQHTPTPEFHQNYKSFKIYEKRERDTSEIRHCIEWQPRKQWVIYGFHFCLIGNNDIGLGKHKSKALCYIILRLSLSRTTQANRGKTPLKSWSVFRLWWSCFDLAFITRLFSGFFINEPGSEPGRYSSLSQTLNSIALLKHELILSIIQAAKILIKETSANSFLICII